MPRYKNPPVVEKKPVQEIRAEIRSYIRNERDTTLKKYDLRIFDSIFLTNYNSLTKI